MDSNQGFVWHFFEGQRVIQDLAKLHSLKDSGFAYYRDLILSTLPVISLLKPGEQFGFYIDSESPYFKFKVEAGYNGEFRTLLIPHDFNQFPDKFTGLARFMKILPKAKPYTSVVAVEQKPTAQIINDILRTSYQIQAQVNVSDLINQSLLVMKLPPASAQSLKRDTSLSSYLNKNSSFIHDLFEHELNDIKKIVEYFELNKHMYMSSKEILFYCPCSEELMISNLKKLSANDLDSILENELSIDVKCDYCQKKYSISKSNLITKED